MTSGGDVLQAGHIMMNLYQALQLAALLPCLFVILFLLISRKSNSNISIAVLYFFSLACSFALPLLPHMAPGSDSIHAAFLFGQSVQPALCYLLILYLLMQSVPRYYWLILLLPAMGGSSIIYASVLTDGDVCFFEDVCSDVLTIKTLYQLFATSVIFLLLMIQVSQLKQRMDRQSKTHHYRYWIVLTLIVLNVALLGFDLSFLLNALSMFEVELLKTIIRIAFIYLVLTSLFRLYDSAKKKLVSDKPVDPAFIVQLEEAMSSDKLHRDMRCNRKMLADTLSVSEHAISRIINQHFKKNISEFINHYRVEEAKQRLRDEDVSITVIAFEVGFSSIASFNRVFKEMVGCSPTQYRAAQSA